MTRPTVLLLSATSGYGHVRAGNILARSLRRKLSSDWDVRHENLCDYASLPQRWCIERFWWAASTWPPLRPMYRVLHRLVVSDDMIGGAFSSFYRSVGGRLAETYSGRDVRAVVALHPGAACACTWWKRTQSFSLYVVATDLIVHSLQVLPGIDAVFASASAVLASRRARAFGQSGGIIFSGLPVDIRFSEVGKVDKIAHEGADEKRLRVVVTFGANGFRANRYIPMLMRLVSEWKGMSMTFVCGHDRRVKAKLSRLVGESGWGDRVDVIGFRRDMAKIIGSSELVIGKAGGLTVGEAMAARRPFIAVEVFPGQEEYNAEVMSSAGCGRVVNNYFELYQAVSQLANGGFGIKARRLGEGISGGGVEAISATLSENLVPGAPICEQCHAPHSCSYRPLGSVEAPSLGGAGV